MKKTRWLGALGVCIGAVCTGCACEHPHGRELGKRTGGDSHAHSLAEGEHASAKFRGTVLTTGEAIRTRHTEWFQLSRGDGGPGVEVLFGGYDANRNASPKPEGIARFRNQDPEWDLEAGWGLLHGTRPMSTTPRVAAGSDGSMLVIWATKGVDRVFLLMGDCAEVRARSLEQSAAEVLQTVCGAGDEAHELSPGYFVEAKGKPGSITISAPAKISWDDATEIGKFLWYVRRRAEAASIWPKGFEPQNQ